MTETNVLTAQDALKSKAKFMEFISELEIQEIDEIISEIPQDTPVCTLVDLTQNIETLLHAINEFGDINPYIVWIVQTTKPSVLKTVEFFNRTRIKNVGIYVIQALLNDNNEMEFNCILKPKNRVSKKEKGEHTPAEVFNQKYWEKYFEICDAQMSDMQIKPNERHFKTLSIGKTGVQIMLTISKSAKFVASEIYISDNKELFDELLSHQEEIEKILGTLSWYRLNDKKASRIVKYFNIDIEDENNLELAIKEQIKMAEDLKAVLKKYL